MATKLDHAFALADEGFRVFPLAPNAKVPNKGFTDYQGKATRDHAQLAKWWQEYGADCNIGIATGGRPGEPQLLVVDFDMKEGQRGAASMQRMLLEDDIDSGYKTRTGSGGQHWYFWLPPGVDVGGSANAIDGYPHVDIRCRGNLVVAEGSARNGKPYTSLLKGEIPVAPPRLIELATGARRRAKERATNKHIGFVDTPENLEKARETIWRDGPAVEDAGGDNHTIATVNRALDYVSPAAALDLLLKWNDDNSPPWDPFDLENKMWSAARSREEVFGSKSAGVEFNDLPPVEQKKLEEDDILAVVDPGTLLGDPPIREWWVPGVIPKGEVTLISGDGGLGKTQLVQQLGTSMSYGRDWLGLAVGKGRVLGVFCEDDADELWRRQKAINRSMGISDEDWFQPSGDFMWVAADQVAVRGGLMMTFVEGGEGKITKFYRALENRIAVFRPDLVIIDPIANVYGGKESDRGQVTFFVNRALKSLCIKYKTTIVALAHPSVAGMESGRGYSGSTAWNAAVRSRLYLTRPKDDPFGDYRQLDGMKSNYGKTGHVATMRYKEGAFVSTANGGAEDDPTKVAVRSLLAAMRLLAERDEMMSPSKQSPYYIMKQLRGLPEIKGLRFELLEEVLEGLKRSGRVVAEPGKTAGRKDIILLRVTEDEFETPVFDAEE